MCVQHGDGGGPLLGDNSEQLQAGPADLKMIFYTVVCGLYFLHIFSVLWIRGFGSAWIRIHFGWLDPNSDPGGQK